MRKLAAILLAIPLLALAQVTTNPSVTGVPAPQSAVAITGGTINGTPIGGTTPAAITGTTVTGTTSMSTPSITINSGTALSAYVENTWVPALTGTGGSITNTVQVGQYTRIGRLTCVQFYLNGTKNTGSGPLSITGLPVAANATANMYVNHAMGDWTITGGSALILGVQLFLSPSGTSFALYKQTAAAAGTNQSAALDATDLSSTFNFGSSFCYNT